MSGLLCPERNPVNINDGTLCCAASPLPGPLGRVGLSCIAYQLTRRPFLIAKAVEFLNPEPPVMTFDIAGSVGGPLKLAFGQDSTYGSGRTPVEGLTVGKDEATLKTKMNYLLAIFAQHDTDGKAKAEFNVFQKKNSIVTMYSDPKLDKAIGIDEQFTTYPDRALNAPGTRFFSPSKIYIHQALAAVGWDVDKVKSIVNLGVPPAFNAGWELLQTGDWGNGLAVMIDAIQYVLIFVNQYEYNSYKNQYIITLIFEIYDIFGIDDEDVKKVWGQTRHLHITPLDGIVAWWQLQHQFNYAPLITKASITKTFTVSIK